MARVTTVFEAAVFEATPQDLVLTMLGAHGGPDAHGGVWSGGLVSVLADFGFSSAAARAALNRLVARELLAPVRTGRLVHYLPTGRCRAVLGEGDRRIFGFGRGQHGGRWTVVWHAIPESRRDARAQLVRRLRFLGFGPVQDGTWLAAHDRAAEVATLLHELDVASHAGVLIGAPAPLPDFGAFVARVWNLPQVAARYAGFVDTFTRRDPASLTDRDAFHTRIRLVHTYRQFPTMDPELPTDLVPAPAGRTDAVELFHRLYPALADGAQRYFDEVIRA